MRRLLASLRRAWRVRRQDRRHAARYPSAQYTVGFVQRDGNMHDHTRFGTDLRGALDLCRGALKTGDRHRIHWYVYDADDPERGYFDDDYEWEND